MYASPFPIATHTDQDPGQIVRHGLEIAGDLCIYSNTNITTLELT